MRVPNIFNKWYGNTVILSNQIILWLRIIIRRLFCLFTNRKKRWWGAQEQLLPSVIFPALNCAGVVLWDWQARRVLHLPRHGLIAWHLHSRIMISNPGHEQYRPLFIENFGNKCFRFVLWSCHHFLLALSHDRNGSFCDLREDASRSLFPMPLLSALSAPCSSSPHFPVGTTFR